MADHDERTPERPQELQQPVTGIRVQVVGRFVEQQDLAAGEQDAGQLQATPLAARQGAHVQVQAVRLQAEAGGHAACLGLGAVAAERLEVLVGLGEGLDGLHRRVFLERDRQLLDPVHRHVQPAARQHVGEACGAQVDVVAAGILGQVAGRLGQAHRAGLRRGRSAERPEQRRLAGAVAAHQADLVAGADVEGDLLDDALVVDLDREVAHDECHWGFFRRRAAWWAEQSRLDADGPAKCPRVPVPPAPGLLGRR